MNALALSPRPDQAAAMPRARALTVVPQTERSFAAWAPAVLPAPREVRFGIPSMIGAAAAIAAATALVPHLLG